MWKTLHVRAISPSSALKSLSQTARNVPSETETQKDPDCLTVASGVYCQMRQRH